MREPSALSNVHHRLIRKHSNTGPSHIFQPIVSYLLSSLHVKLFKYVVYVLQLGLPYKPQ